MDSDLVWVTSESSNVVVNPLNGQTLVAKPCIRRPFFDECLSLRKSESTESIVDLDIHNRMAVVDGFQLHATWLRQDPVLVAGNEAPSMDIEQNGQFISGSSAIWSPDIQSQAIFRDFSNVIVSSPYTERTMGELLRAGRSWDLCMNGAFGWWSEWYGRLEAIVIAGIQSITNTHEAFYLVLVESLVRHVDAMDIASCGELLNGYTAHEGGPEKREEDVLHRECEWEL